MKKLLITAIAVLSLFATVGCKKVAQVSITNLADLDGKKIGCQAGTTGEYFVQDNVKASEVKSFKTGIDAALDLKNGAIDAVVLDELPAKEIVKRNKDLTIVNADFYIEEYAIAVKKGNVGLLNSINKTISTIKADGTYESLINAFMPVDGNIVLPAAVENNGTGVVKMGTNASFPPFEYISGTEPVGFDVTMSQIIAKDYGKQLQVVDMAFDGLIAALQSDAIDFIAAGMTATDERRKNVDFSDSYFSSKQVIIIRK